MHTDWGDMNFLPEKFVHPITYIDPQGVLPSIHNILYLTQSVSPNKKVLFAGGGVKGMISIDACVLITDEELPLTE